jgi:preprotein translocase subunit SecA
MKALPDAQLSALTGSFKSRLGNGQSLQDLLPEAFAAVREAAARALGERPSDVQVMGAAVLHLGKVAEIRAGEGTTLTAVMPAYLHALSGTPVHVITANDYRARRDALQMTPVYRFLGVTAGLVLSREEQDLEDRRAAYRAEVTYGTWQQFSYDYLFDNCVRDLDKCVHRGLGLAIVDEADLVLIDQAREVARIISTPEKPNRWHAVLAEITPRLRRASGGAGDYEVDVKARTVSLLEPGTRKVEDWLGVDDLYAGGNGVLADLVTSALAAKELYQKDRDYLVADGKLVVINPFTGRPDPDHFLGDGTHQAIEAKEGLQVSPERETLAEIQGREYLRLYQRLAAMAGVAADESDAYGGGYGLDVVTIPTRRPVIRRDDRDAFCLDTPAKLKAVADEAAARHATGQPVLIGAISVAEAESVSAQLSGRGIAHEVLNGRNHQREAEVLAGAGRPGAVTVVTPMAGPGVDIRLGGADGAARAQVADLGGLCVLGAGRHTLRRLDLHLLARAGTQGDPGETKFFLSLDDELMAWLLSPKQAARFRRMVKAGPDELIGMGLIVSNAQDSWRAAATTSLLRSLEFDAVLADQQRVIYADRRTVVLREGLGDEARHMIDTVITEWVSAAQGPADARLWQSLRALYPVGITPGGLAADRGCAPEDLPRELVIERVTADARSAYDQREAGLGADAMRTMEVSVMMAVTDWHWREHLRRMHALRAGIHLRALGGRSPLADYQREAGLAFTELRRAIQASSVRYLFRETAAKGSTPPDHRDAGELWPVSRMAAPLQLAVSPGDAPLKIGDRRAGRRVLARVRAFGSGGYPGVGAGDERVPGRRRPWRGAGEKLAEIIGPRHAGSRVVRVPG